MYVCVCVCLCVCVGRCVCVCVCAGMCVSVLARGEICKFNNKMMIRGVNSPMNPYDRPLVGWLVSRSVDVHLHLNAPSQHYSFEK